MAEAIRVAVRIRPFISFHNIQYVCTIIVVFFNYSHNQREKNREAKLVLKANGPTVTLVDPKSSSKRNFTFDHTYWSHDGFEEDETGYMYPVNSGYADQVRLLHVHVHVHQCTYIL